MRTLLSCVITGALLAGCADTQPLKVEPTYAEAENSEFIASSYKAADQLAALANPKLVAGQAMIVATVVNIDDLDHSATLGRAISEQVSARFTQMGHRMIEMKFRESVYMKRTEGELMLTREIGEVAKSHNAQAVIAGTYAIGGNMVFVNLKVIQPVTNAVLGAYDYALPVNSSVRSMLIKKR